MQWVQFNSNESQWGTTLKAGMPAQKLQQPRHSLPGHSVPRAQGLAGALPTNLPGLAASALTCFKTTGPATLSLYREAGELLV